MQPQVMTVSLQGDGYLLTTIEGDLSEERIATLKDDIERSGTFIRNEFEKHGQKKFKALIDLTKFSGVYTPEVLLVLAEYEKHNAPYIEKSAGFGGAASTRLAAEIVSGFSGRENISFFKTKDEALAWLAA